MTDQRPCPFCHPDPESIVRRSEFGFVLRDAYPVSPGHSLIVPVRHEASYFALEPLEQADLLNLLVAVRRGLVDEFGPDGFNIGLNDGTAAGQTIDHCHWHVVPRYAGDVVDPRGGVRWILPDRAPYWNSQA